MSTPAALTLDQIGGLIDRHAAIIQPVADQIVAQGLASVGIGAVQPMELDKLIATVPQIVADTIEEGCQSPVADMSFGEKAEALGRIIRLTLDTHTMSGVTTYLAFAAMRLTRLPLANAFPIESAH